MITEVIKILLLLIGIVVTYYQKKKDYLYLRKSFSVMTVLSIWTILRDEFILTQDYINVFTNRFSPETFGSLMTVDAFTVLMIQLISSYWMIKFIKETRKKQNRNADILNTYVPE